jgi:nucleotide-binding universal stress UspA family protein
MSLDVVLATDLSESSRAAARAAADYARRLGARLHVLHVLWPTSDAAAGPALERLAGELRATAPVVTAVESGMPAADIIVRYAERQRASLIVMGTHGRTGVSRALLGSVAERVVRTAPCPVLTVPASWAGEPAAAPGPAVPEAAPRSCLVCQRPSDDLVCEACRARIRGEAVERKQREERPGRA